MTDAAPDIDGLLPCPFDGSRAWLIVAPDTKRTRAQCTHCGASMGEFDQGSLAILAWNRRATPTPPPAPEVEAIVAKLAPIYEAAQKDALVHGAGYLCVTGGAVVRIPPEHIRLRSGPADQAVAEIRAELAKLEQDHMHPHGTVADPEEVDQCDACEVVYALRRAIDAIDAQAAELADARAARRAASELVAAAHAQEDFEVLSKRVSNLEIALADTVRALAEAGRDRDAALQRAEAAERELAKLTPLYPDTPTDIRPAREVIADLKQLCVCGGPDVPRCLYCETRQLLVKKSTPPAAPTELARELLALEHQLSPQVLVFEEDVTPKLVREVHGLLGRAAAALSRREPEGLSEPELSAIAAAVVRNVCELPGYTSPEDNFDLVTCTTEELEGCVLSALSHLSAQPGQEQQT